MAASAGVAAHSPRLRQLPRCGACGLAVLGSEDGGEEPASAIVSEVRAAVRGIRVQETLRLFHPRCLVARRHRHRRRAGIELAVTVALSLAFAALAWSLQLTPALALPLALLGVYASYLEVTDTRSPSFLHRP